MDSEKYFLWFLFNKKIKSKKGKQVMLGDQPLPYMPIRMSVSPMSILESNADKARWKSYYVRPRPAAPIPKVYVLKSELSLEEATDLFRSMQVQPELWDIRDLDPSLINKPEFKLI